MSRATTPTAPRQGTSFAADLNLESLEARENPTVNYYGGALLPHVETQAVYYGSAWSADPSTRAYTDAFLKDVTGGAYMDALTRAGYGVGRGTSTTGVVDPLGLTSGTTITDASIRARLKTDVSSGAVSALDANKLYVVFVQPNVAINLGSGQGTTQQGILGYHGAFAAANGATIRYAVIAYPGGAAHNSSLGTAAVDQLTAVTSHELSEAVTDPDVNYKQLGWYDPQRGEIGDITENNPAAFVRSNGYLVQLDGDKNDQLLTLAPATTPTPTPTPTVTATSTTLTSSAVVHHGSYSTATLTITVKPGSGTALPGGTVNLIYGGKVIGTATLSVVNGVETAKFNVTFYGTGDFAFSAQYVGDTQFQSSTSGTLHVLV